MKSFFRLRSETTFQLEPPPLRYTPVVKLEFVKSLHLFFRKHRGPLQARWHRRMLAAAYGLRAARSALRLLRGSQRPAAVERTAVLLSVLRGLLLGFGAERSAEARLRLGV